MQERVGQQGVALEVLQVGQRQIFWPLPLCEGVSTSSGWPWISSTRSVSITAFRANEAPVSRWHQRQWQACTTIGAVVMR